MVTIAEEEETPQPESETLIRNIIAGHPQGAVRRIVLYVLLFSAIGVGVYFAPVLLVALVASVLLIATDSLL